MRTFVNLVSSWFEVTARAICSKTVRFLTNADVVAVVASELSEVFLLLVSMVGEDLNPPQID